MPRLALSVEYIGDKFHGSQYQLGVRTVQKDLEDALEVLTKKKVRVTFSGRTDAGVHARGQVAHIDLDESDFNIDKIVWSLNGILKRDMAVSKIQVVDDSFHARFSATKREYVYRILNRPQRSPLLKNTHHFIRDPLDLKAMSDGAFQLRGKNNFSAFRSRNADTSNPVCLVSRSEMVNLGEGCLEFWIVADHFVYNMVRIIVGTLVEIGLGKRSVKNIVDALETGERSLCGPTAPAKGLTLNSVEYPKKYCLFKQNSNEKSGVIP